MILSLGEMNVVQLWMGPQVLLEADRVLERKAPESKARFALLLDQARIQIVAQPGEGMLAQARAVTTHGSDTRVLSEALAAAVEYFVTLDRQHFLHSPHATSLLFPMGTPGDFLAWMRKRMQPAGPR